MQLQQSAYLVIAMYARQVWLFTSYRPRVAEAYGSCSNNNCNIYDRAPDIQVKLEPKLPGEIEVAVLYVAQGLLLPKRCCSNDRARAQLREPM